MAGTYTNRGFTIALGLFAVLLAGYAFLQSPLFSLQSVQLTGNDRLSVGLVLERTELDYGVNLLEIEVRAVESALAELPFIVDVSVARRLPGTLVVRVRERTPIAYVAGERGFWAIDSDGVLLYGVDAPTKPLPLVTADLNDQVVREAGVVLDGPHIKAALDFVGALGVTTLASLSEIHASAAGVTAYTRDRITVSLGTGGDMREKAEVFEVLFAKAMQGNLNISHIDVRHPRSPVVEEKR